MGGTDDPSNLVELTPEEHAEAHRKLYEEHGQWQDYVAWQGLAKLASKEEHVHMLLSKAGKKGNMSRIANGQTNKGKKYKKNNLRLPKNQKGSKNPNAKEYLVTYPDGTTEKVKALTEWCESNDLNHNSLYNQCVGRGKKHKGYMVEKI